VAERPASYADFPPHLLSWFKFSMPSQPAESGISCHICNQQCKNIRGLAIHQSTNSRCKDLALNSSINPVLPANSQSIPPISPAFDSPEDFSTILCKNRECSFIMDRIPRGSRKLLANKLASIIDRIASSNSLNAWIQLLSFALLTLILPISKASRSESLSSIISKNLSNFDSGLPNDPTPKPAPKLKNHNVDDALCNAALRKFNKGNLKATCRILLNEDSVADPNDASYLRLLDKHPQYLDHDLTGLSDPPACDNFQPIKVSEVQQAIRSFPADSAGGLDGLKATHLLDLTINSDEPAAKGLLESICKLCNLMLQGRVPTEICPILYGGKLISIKKKCGGIRPIAMGNIFRRIVAKIICKRISGEAGNILRPHQLGCATKAGGEAIIHAIRSEINFHAENSSDQILLKIDCINAFNLIKRSEFIKAFSSKFPSYYNFIWQCYKDDSILQYGHSYQISSRNGVQQGDPLGPLLFSLLTIPICDQLSSSCKSFYLDDGVLCGSLENILSDIEMIKSIGHSLGMSLNPEKCEAYIINPSSNSDIMSALSSSLPGIQFTSASNLCLLGAPLLDDGICPCLDSKLQLISKLTDRLSILPAHVAFYILQHCFGIPRLTYLLRSCPTWKFLDKLQEIDLLLRLSLSKICNVQINDQQFLQASLPVRFGGLGIRSAKALALPAYLASMQACSTLSYNITGRQNQDQLEILITAWESNSSTTRPDISQQYKQSNWDIPLVTNAYNYLLDLVKNDEISSARILSCSSKSASAWLCAYPNSIIGNLLDNNTFRISIAIRLGCAIFEPHNCYNCGQQVDKLGLHGLACKSSAGRFYRHNSGNDVFNRALNSAGIPSRKEPLHLLRDDGKRPDGTTMIPLDHGKCTAWDITYRDTFAKSYIKSTCKIAGAAASLAEAKKISKYSNILATHSFIPIAIETGGAIGKEGLCFINRIGKLLIQQTGDTRASGFFKQRISLVTQRGNAICIMGTCYSNDSFDELFLL
jgi:hypothetical protein